MIEGLEGLNERLGRVFDGRIRARWSAQEKAVSVEQKFGRSNGVGVQEDDEDSVVRAREGYLQIFSIQPGDRMECPQCHAEVKVPVNEFAQVECWYCKSRGRDQRFIVGYFDLDSDRVVEHLLRLDPLRDHSRGLREKMVAHNARLQKQKDEAPHERAREYVSDMPKELFGVAHVGYTGREVSWPDAPQQKQQGQKE